MARCRKRKCRSCGELFGPDVRNRQRQRYCAKAECRRESKRASQAAWLARPENRDYFRGPGHVERVRRWRAEHPGYWRRKGTGRREPLQDDSTLQLIAAQGDAAPLQEALPPLALQDLWGAAVPVVVGLIAGFTGLTLQEDIVRTAREFHARGQMILGMGPGTDPRGDRRDRQKAAAS